MELHPGDPALVSPRARTLAYLVSLIVGALAVAAMTITAVLWPDRIEQVAATAGAIATLTGTITAGLATGYRPTREQD